MICFTKLIESSELTHEQLTIDYVDVLRTRLPDYNKAAYPIQLLSQILGTKKVPNIFFSFKYRKCNLICFMLALWVSPITGLI